MAADKKSFIMYESWATLIADLPQEQAGDLVKAICCFQTGKEYKVKDPTVNAIWSMIRNKMQEDQEAYEGVKQRRRDAAAERWNGCKTMHVDEQPMQNDANALTTDANGCKTMHVDGDTDTVSDTVSDSVSDTETDNEHPTGAKEKRSAQARPARHKHGQYGHVLLTDQQLSDLRAKHGEAETEAAIRAVDEYCEQSGKSYKNYALTMEKWGYRSANEQRARSGTTRQQPVDANDYLLSIINGEVTPGDNAGSG